MKKLKIWNRDIKPDNILYGHNSSGKLWFKFTDYGLGKVDTSKDYIYRQDVKRLAHGILVFRTLSLIRFITLLT